MFFKNIYAECFISSSILEYVYCGAKYFLKNVELLQRFRFNRILKSPHVG